MTEQELRKLRRVDLLEILLDLSKENEVLRTQLEKARVQLTSRTIAIEKSGSLAEAALRINGVFEAAQAACEQYTLNMQQRVGQQEQICRDMEQKAQETCDRMLQDAKNEAAAIKDEADAYLFGAKAEADALRSSMQSASESNRNAAQVEAEEIRAAALQEAEEIRARADAYRVEVEKAVKGMVDSYSWLTKALN